MSPLAAFFLLLPFQDPGRTGYSSPPTGDTAGYWQQRVTYTIVATLDEPAQRIRARGTLRYVNNSPDTLREMFVHQYLNAFRPGSRWSSVDEREGRERFQRLPEPHYGYERFSAPVRVDGAAVDVEYPGAPDSTVARFALPTPLAPRDSITVEFVWDARPSTLPRRQGRRGRHWDLSQWFPKVAVYDRGGWQPNALQPAGEFYGEFGTYDVTLIVRQDQVLGATGVPVAGNPGWSRVIRGGRAHLAADAYGPLPPSPAVVVPSGYRAVRFFARDVHHFAWTASPDYRYEGGVYVRSRASRTLSALPRWDTVAVHALWRTGDDTTWGGLRAVQRTIAALRWLESYYGPYPYPQLTSNHRLDSGGSELPMFMMNSSASTGLILHEGGHMYTFGILANNEWRSGWMDEGATSYQTAWAQSLTPQERVRAGIVDRPRPVSGYRALGIRMALPRFEIVALGQAIADILGEAEPMGTVSHEFRDFNTYNDMIYDRSEVMHGQLRDLLGDSMFIAVNQDYYDHWALKHVDERALRASAERASGRDLDWFFDQWVHRTGLTDYQLRRIRQRRDNGSGWITEATVRRRGEYRHAMPVGVRTASGWTIARLSAPPYDEETVRIATREEPREVRLDPHHFTWDWDRRNDHRGSKTRYNVDWPFLEQADRERNVALIRPLLWYSEPGGVVVALRQRRSYLGFVDKIENGFGYAIDPLVDVETVDRIPVWFRLDNLTIAGRPRMPLALNGAWLDAVTFAQIGGEWNRVAGQRAIQYRVDATAAEPRDRSLLPESWDDVSTIDLALAARYQRGGRSAARRSYNFIDGRLIAGTGDDAYGKAEVAVGMVRTRRDDRARFHARVYAGTASNDVPRQRGLLVSASDPVTTFFNHWWRPRGALLKRQGFNWLPLGGAALRGFRSDVSDRSLVGTNLEVTRQLYTVPIDGEPEIWLQLFGDAAIGARRSSLYDAGLGVSLRGRVYDRDIILRLDAPLYVSHPTLSIDRDATASRHMQARWVLTFNDIW